MIVIHRSPRYTKNPRPCATARPTYTIGTPAYRDVACFNQGMYAMSLQSQNSQKPSRASAAVLAHCLEYLRHAPMTQQQP